jgi:DNA invertase Pin-like site-specific DNA recombinase
MTATAALRAAVYLRQSQDREDNQLAISRQRADCTKLCKAKGWTVTEYVDNDRSAFNGKPRPAYTRMLTDICAGKIDAVVAWHQDRLHRDVMELLQFGDVARKHDLKLATVSGDIDLSTDDGEFMATMGAAIARKEVRRKSERQKRAAEQRAEQGTQWWSARPFGFAYTDGKPLLDSDGQPVLNSRGKPKWAEPRVPILDERGAPTLDPAEAAEIRAAYSAVLAGKSVYAVTADLNNRGVATPRGNRWRPSQTRQLLLSPRNAGLRTFRNQVVGAGNWPAIVTESTWRAVATKLSDPSRRTGKSRARKHLLSRLADCGCCGAPLGSGVNSSGGVIYVCRSCNKVSRNGAKLEALVVEKVVDRLSRPDAADLITDTGRPDIAALTDARASLREQQAALGNAHADGQLSLTAFSAADKRFTEQIDALTAQITDADSAQVFADVIGPDADARFAVIGLDRQRAVIAALLAITVHPTGRCGRVFDIGSIDLVLKK